MVNPVVFRLSLIGLAISIIGSILLYFGTPVDNGKVRTLANLKVGDNTPDVERKKGIERRKKLSRTGFILLFTGFVIQFITVLLQAP